MTVRLISRDDIEFSPAEVDRWLERGGILKVSAGRTYLVPRLRGAGGGGAKADLSKPIAGIESAAGKMGTYADTASSASTKYMGTSDAALAPVMSYYQNVMKGGSALMGAIAPGVSAYTKQRQQGLQALDDAPGSNLVKEYARYSSLLNSPIPAMAQSAQQGAVTGLQGLGQWYGGEARGWAGDAVNATAAQGGLFGTQGTLLNEQARANAASAAARNNMIASLGQTVGGPLLNYGLKALSAPASTAATGTVGSAISGSTSPAAAGMLFPSEVEALGGATAGAAGAAGVGAEVAAPSISALGAAATTTPAWMAAAPIAAPEIAGAGAVAPAAAEAASASAAATGGSLLGTVASVAGPAAVIGGVGYVIYRLIKGFSSTEIAKDAPSYNALLKQQLDAIPPSSSLPPAGKAETGDIVNLGGEFYRMQDGMWSPYSPQYAT